MKPIGTLPALLRIIGLTLRATGNRIVVNVGRRRARGDDRVRVPTPGKRRGVLTVLGVLIAVGATFQAYMLWTMLANRVVAQLDPLVRVQPTVHDELAGFAPGDALAGSPRHDALLRAIRRVHLGVDVADDTDARREAMRARFARDGVAGFRAVPHRPFGVSPPAPGSGGDFVAVMAVVWSALGATLLALSLGLGRQDLGKVEEHDLWLATLPLPTRALTLARLAGFMLDPIAWVTVLPLATVCLLAAGATGLAGTAMLALAGAAAFIALIAAARLTVETLLRQSLPAAGLKNAQALATVLALLLMVAIYATAFLPEVSALAIAGARAAPTWWTWCAPASLLASVDPPPIATIGAQIAFAAVAVAVALAIAGRALARGFVSHANPYAGARGVRGGGFAPLGVLGKDLLLLRRDRNQLVAAVMVPLVMVGLQLVINRDMARAILGDFRHAATFAFATAAYLLMTTAIASLAVEGQGLWLLFAAPQPLERLLARKAALWAAVAVGYAGIALAILVWLVPALPLGAISDAALALVGAALFAPIAVGIGALACDPMDPNPKRRVAPTSVYLFMLLAMMHANAIYAGGVAVRLTQVALTSLLALALWQKLRDRLPYLLDPVDAPPPRIDVADGVIAVLAFFVVQSLLVMAMTLGGVAPAPAVAIGYACAGVGVSVVVLLALRHAGVPDLLRAIGLRRAAGAPSRWTGFALGIGCGAAAAAVAQAWLALVAAVPALADVAEATASVGLGIDDPWIIGLLVIAAPVCEETIFRGLLLTGLMRMMRPTTAVLANALLFALVHPPIGAPAVFVLGLACAIAHRRSGSLTAPIVAHAIYNAVIVALA
ncbi:MAG TPA: CPBP family intramembrane glutamic endopeptidase [Planctomycetota bacterium]|nr:CPBP family intramembrane glutamic endopeptidase [Planctomycetota bacterium]